MENVVNSDARNNSTGMVHMPGTKKQPHGFLAFFVEPGRAKAVLEQYASQGWEVARINVFDSAWSGGFKTDYFVVMEKKA